MKKIWTLVVIAILSFSMVLAACSNSKNEDSKYTPDTNQTPTLNASGRSGNYTLNYQGSFLVYTVDNDNFFAIGMIAVYNFTNNSSNAISFNNAIAISAEQNSKTLSSARDIFDSRFIYESADETVSRDNTITVHIAFKLDNTNSEVKISAKAKSDASVNYIGGTFAVGTAQMPIDMYNGGYIEDIDGSYYYLEIGEAELAKDFSNKDIIKIHFTDSNYDTADAYPHFYFDICAYQNGIELQYTYNYTNGSTDFNNVLNAIKPNSYINITVAFELISFTAPIFFTIEYFYDADDCLYIELYEWI